MSDMSYNRKIINGQKANAHTTINAITTNFEEYQETNANAKNERSAKYNDSLDLNEFVEESKTPSQEEPPIYQQVGATVAVGATSILSGVLDVGESLLDGVVWCGSTIASWFGADTTKAKEFISKDLVSEANEVFYENTELGRNINDASYMKYDSETAQGIREVSEGVTTFVAATATGGGALTAGLGVLSGVGNKSEEVYQKTTDTTLAQEAGILLRGIGEGASWYAQGQLGQAAKDFAKILKTSSNQIFQNFNLTTLKNTGAQIVKGAQSALEYIKNNGIFKPLKDFVYSSIKNSSFTSLQAADKLADSIVIIVDNISEWLIGDEEFNETNALKATGELLGAWVLNMFFDGASTHLENLNQLKTNSFFNNVETTSLGSRFDDYAISGKATYGIDQAACKRMTYNQRINNDWLTDPQDFKEFLKNKYPTWPDNEIEDAFKILTEKERISDIGKIDIMDYIQKNSIDYDTAFTTYNNSFIAKKADDYDRIIKKYVDAGFSEADAIYLLKTIDTVGVCSYAAVANNIVASFVNNPQLFKETFGYDLFKLIDGQTVFNSSELLADLYVFANLDSNGGKLFTNIDGKLSYITKDFADQTYLSGGMYTRDDIIDKFLKSKSQNFGYSDNIKVVSNNSQGLFFGMTDSTKYTLEDIKNIFNEVLANDNSVQLGIYRTPHNKFTFYNSDGSINITTNNWNEGSGHAVFVTGIDDEGVIVSSWGEKLKIKYEDFINNRYNIAWGKITGITPETIPTLPTNIGTEKIVTDGIGDTASISIDGYKRYDTYGEFVEAMKKNREKQTELDIASKERLSSLLEGYKNNNPGAYGSYTTLNGYLRKDTFIINPQTGNVDQVVIHTSGGFVRPFTKKEFQKKFKSNPNTLYISQAEIAQFLHNQISECPLGENIQLARGINWDALSSFGINSTDAPETILKKLQDQGDYVEYGFASCCPLLNEAELPGILTEKPVRLILNVNGSTGAFDLSDINSKELE
ncbi:MAG: hypothetical protein IJZ77_04330, partial [Bacilli bacterium]|nr:hypothetical protein [Bacilli bacterium]